MNAARPHNLKHSAALRLSACALGACAVAGLAGCSPSPVSVATDPVAAVRAAAAAKVHSAKVATTVTMTVDGKDQLFKFNYKEVIHQKNLQQNVLLKPGDTVIVP